MRDRGPRVVVSVVLAALVAAAVNIVTSPQGLTVPAIAFVVVLVAGQALWEWRRASHEPPADPRGRWGVAQKIKQVSGRVVGARRPPGDVDVAVDQKAETVERGGELVGIDGAQQRQGSGLTDDRGTPTDGVTAS